jgi:hypothetical protein
MDDTDRASEREEQARKDALALRMPAMKPIGRCYWCDSDTHGNALFCSIDCRDDYQKAQDAKKRNGVK